MGEENAASVRDALRGASIGAGAVASETSGGKLRSRERQLLRAIALGNVRGRDVHITESRGLWAPACRLAELGLAVRSSLSEDEKSGASFRVTTTGLMALDTCLAIEERPSAPAREPFPFYIRTSIARDGVPVVEIESDDAPDEYHDAERSPYVRVYVNEALVEDHRPEGAERRRRLLEARPPALDRTRTGAPEHERA